MSEINHKNDQNNIEEPIYTAKEVENVRKNIIGSLASEIAKANTNHCIEDVSEAYENSMKIVNDCWKNI